MKAPQNALLAKHDQSGAESPETAHDVESEHRAKIESHRAGRALGEDPAIEEEKAERHDDGEEEKNFVARRKTDAHVGESKKISQSRSLLPVSSMKTSSREGVAISRLTSSLPLASRCLTSETIACGGRWVCRT